jgi:hypothetical protein
MSDAKPAVPTDHELSQRLEELSERWNELRGRL